MDGTFVGGLLNITLVSGGMLSLGPEASLSVTDFYVHGGSVVLEAGSSTGAAVTSSSATMDLDSLTLQAGSVLQVSGATALSLMNDMVMEAGARLEVTGTSPSLELNASSLTVGAEARLTVSETGSSTGSSLSLNVGTLDIGAAAMLTVSGTGSSLSFNVGTLAMGAAARLTVSGTGSSLSLNVGTMVVEAGSVLEAGSAVTLNVDTLQVEAGVTMSCSEQPYPTGSACIFDLLGRNVTVHGDVSGGDIRLASTGNMVVSGVISASRMGSYASYNSADSRRRRTLIEVTNPGYPGSVFFPTDFGACVSDYRPGRVLIEACGDLRLDGQVSASIRSCSHRRRSWSCSSSSCTGGSILVRAKVLSGGAQLSADGYGSYSEYVLKGGLVAVHAQEQQGQVQVSASPEGVANVFISAAPDFLHYPRSGTVEERPRPDCNAIAPQPCAAQEIPVTAARLRIQAPPLGHGSSVKVDCPWGHTGRVMLSCFDGVFTSDDAFCHASCTVIGRRLIASPVSALQAYSCSDMEHGERLRLPCLTGDGRLMTIWCSDGELQTDAEVACGNTTTSTTSTKTDSTMTQTTMTATSATKTGSTTTQGTTTWATPMPAEPQGAPVMPQTSTTADLAVAPVPIAVPTFPTFPPSPSVPPASVAEQPESSVANDITAAPTPNPTGHRAAPVTFRTSTTVNAADASPPNSVGHEEANRANDDAAAPSPSPPGNREGPTMPWPSTTVVVAANWGRTTAMAGNITDTPPAILAEQVHQARSTTVDVAAAPSSNHARISGPVDDISAAAPAPAMREDTPGMLWTSTAVDVPSPNPEAQAVTTPQATASAKRSPPTEGDKDGAVPDNRTVLPPSSGESSGIVLSPETLWAIVGVVVAFIAALALGAIACAIKRRGWRQSRGAGQKPATEKAVEAREAANFLEEVRNSFPTSCPDPGFHGDFADDVSTTLSQCPSSLSQSPSYASNSATIRVQGLQVRYKAARREAEKITILQEARSVAENGVGTSSCKLCFDLLQHALELEKDLRHLQSEALGHVTDMATGKWQVGWLSTKLARDLLLSCHLHPSQPARVRAIELTAQLMKSDNADDVDTAFEALQSTFERLSKSRAKKEDLREELRAVLDTYKEAMGEDPRLTEVKAKIKEFVLKAAMGSAGKAAGGVAESLQPWLLETLREIPAWQELRSMTGELI